MLQVATFDNEDIQSAHMVVYGNLFSYTQSIVILYVTRFLILRQHNLSKSTPTYILKPISYFLTKLKSSLTFMLSIETSVSASHVSFNTDEFGYRIKEYDEKSLIYQTTVVIIAFCAIPFFRHVKQSIRNRMRKHMKL